MFQQQTATSRTDRSSWLRAVAGHLSAEKALNEHPYGKTSPASADYARLEADHRKFLDASTAALKTVLSQPAPDVRALAEKLSILAEVASERDEVGLIAADAKRLAFHHSSLLMALHQHYEQVCREYETVEKAKHSARQDDDEYHASRYQTALGASVQETDALRVAILHQVPESWVEAMVLQFHIANAFDMLANSEGPPPEHEQEALQTAIDTLFDFMCCEVRQDHGALGSSFKAGAGRVFLQRRYRTGDVED